MTAKPTPLTGLDLLRAPFPEHQISKLPKPTKQQTEAVRNDYKKGIRCQICGTWHHPDVVHLDYVGHAALTDRLLDCDPNWTWEPCVEPGLPNPGPGMWIKLTVCGVTRIGYGHADGKTGGDAIKETIGDALRNAAMRFGAALDLWHKGDLHLSEDTPEGGEPEPKPAPALITDAQLTELQMMFTHLGVPVAEFLKVAKIATLDKLPANWFDRAKKWVNDKAAEKRAAPETTAEALDDEIQY
jgi:hypothetical protein